MNGLPGIEALFREHKRLSSKLTKDEMKALRHYLDERLMYEQNEMLFQLNTLRTNYDANTHKMEDTISRLRKELEFKSQLMNQYKSTDTNLATVHKQREERLEQKHNALSIDLQKTQNEVQSLTNQVNELKRDLHEKSRLIEEQCRELQELESVHSKVRQAEELIGTNAHIQQDILRIKLTADAKDREIQKLKSEIQPLKTEVSSLKEQLHKYQEKCCHFEEEMKKQTKELQAKNENLAIAKYHLDVERRRVKELENELEECKNKGMSERKSVTNTTETSRMRAEVIKIHHQHLESRVKILEEKVAMYRTHCRNLGQEITMISDELSRVSNLKDRVIVHGTTHVEKLLLDVEDSMNNRKISLEGTLDDLVQQIPGIISQDSIAIKTDTNSVKKQAELNKINDIVLKSTRLLQRVEACEKAKFVYSNINSPTKKPNQNAFVNSKVKAKEQNLTLTLAARAEKRNSLSETKDSVEDSNTEKCFTRVHAKSPSGQLLSRPKQVNGPPVPTAWRRKQSFTMELSPSLIDLTMSPVTSPSAREKGKQFFNSSSFSSIQNGVRGDRRSLSEQGDR